MPKSETSTKIEIENAERPDTPFVSLAPFLRRFALVGGPPCRLVTLVASDAEEADRK
jgi:hypothetical protein